MSSITPDNFISRWWSFESRVYSTIYSSPDSPPEHASFKLSGSLLTLKLGGMDTSNWTARLSNNQVKAFIKKLNKVRFNFIDTKRIEYPEVLFTLIFSDENNEDQDVNWGFFHDTAKSNLDFEKHLIQLVQTKFPDLLLVSPKRSNK